MYGDLESHDAECRFLAEQSGVQVLAIEYRLSPEHKFPAAVEDCRAAYRWLVEHTDEVNADVTRLAVGGDSAGGAMSAATAVYAADNDLPLAFQLLVYPGTDFVGTTESRTLFSEGFFLTDLFITSAEEAYFAPGADKSHPDASALRRVDFPEKLAPALRGHRRLRPVARRGRGLRRAVAVEGRGGGRQALPRHDPRVHERGRRGPRVPCVRPGHRRSPPGCARLTTRHTG